MHHFEIICVSAVASRHFIVSLCLFLGHFTSACFSSASLWRYLCLTVVVLHVNQFVSLYSPCASCCRWFGAFFRQFVSLCGCLVSICGQFVVTGLWNYLIDIPIRHVEEVIFCFGVFSPPLSFIVRVKRCAKWKSPQFEEGSCSNAPYENICFLESKVCKPILLGPSNKSMSLEIKIIWPL